MLCLYTLSTMFCLPATLVRVVGTLQGSHAAVFATVSLLLHSGVTGAMIMPWKNVRTMVWDATCPDTFAPSHVAHAAREAGMVANQAERNKCQKYALLCTSHHFVPIAIETSGVFGPESASFFGELGRRIRSETGEPRSLQFLLQGISVAVQQGNAAAVLGTAPATDNVYV